LAGEWDDGDGVVEVGHVGGASGEVSGDVTGVVADCGLGRTWPQPVGLVPSQVAPLNNDTVLPRNGTPLMFTALAAQRVLVGRLSAVAVARGPVVGLARSLQGTGGLVPGVNLLIAAWFPAARLVASELNATS